MKSTILLNLTSLLLSHMGFDILKVCLQDPILWTYLLDFLLQALK